MKQLAKEDIDQEGSQKYPKTPPNSSVLQLKLNRGIIFNGEFTVYSELWHLLHNTTSAGRSFNDAAEDLVVWDEVFQRSAAAECGVCAGVGAWESTQPDLPAQGCSSRLTQAGRRCQRSTATMEDHSVIFSSWRPKKTTSIESSNEQKTIWKSALLMSHNQVLRLTRFCFLSCSFSRRRLVHLIDRQGFGFIFVPRNSRRYFVQHCKTIDCQTTNGWTNIEKCQGVHLIIVCSSSQFVALPQ